MAEYARETTSRRRPGSRTSEETRETKSAKSSGFKAGAAAGVSTAALLDIVERLGLVDILIDRLKQKLDAVEVDDLIEDLGRYLKRNPEVLVVSLGAITLTAGALVYLNRRNEALGTTRSSARRARPLDEADN
jgi:hypothetical protein